MDLETTNENKMTASQARDKFLMVWDKCEYGIKERVKKCHSHRTIQYILETETYSKTQVILDVLETIKNEVKAVKEDVIAMSNDVQESLSAESEAI